MQFTPAPHLTQHWQLTKPAASGRRGMVVSQCKDAAEAGVAVLDAGGNAIDAAVATALALAAVEPWNSGLGGIGHAVIHRAGEARAETVDFGPTAPAALNPNLFKLTGRVAADLFGWPGVEGDVNIHGPLSFVIPSAVAGYEEVHRRWGKLPLAEIAAPAIALAKRGLPEDWYTSLKVGVSAPILQEICRERAHLSARWPAADAALSGRAQLLPAREAARHAGAARAGGLARFLRRRDREGDRRRREGARRRAVGGGSAQLQGARLARRQRLRGAGARCSSPARSPRHRPRPMCCAAWRTCAPARSPTPPGMRRSRAR